MSLAATFGVGFSVVFYFFLVGGEEKNMFCIHSRPKRVVLVCASRWGTVSTNECRSTKRYLTTALSHVTCRLLFSPLGDTIEKFDVLSFFANSPTTEHTTSKGRYSLVPNVRNTCVVINHVVW